MKNPFALSQPLPGLDMMKVPKTPKAGGLGLKGPWSLDPGSPNFPNHRPYLSNPKAPNSAPQPITQKAPKI